MGVICAPMLLGFVLSAFAGNDQIVRLKIMALIEAVGLMLWLLYQFAGAVGLV